MGDVIHMANKGSCAETPLAVLEEVAERPELRGIVLLFGEDPTELYVTHSEECDPVSVHYVLSLAARWQLED